MQNSRDDGLAAAVDRVRSMADGPVRSVEAANLVVALMRSPETAGDPARLRIVGEMVEIADRHAPVQPEWRRVRAAALIMVLMGAANAGTLPDPAAAIRQVNELESSAGGDPSVGMLAGAARSMFSLLVADANGDQAAKMRSIRDLEGLATQVSGQAGGSDFVAYVGAVKDLYELASTGGDVTGALDVLRDTAGSFFPEGSPLLDSVRSQLDAIRALLAQRGGAATTDTYPAMAEAALRPDLSDAERRLRHIVAGGVALDGGEQRDPDRLAAGIGHFRAALALSGPDEPRHAFLLFSLGLGLYRRIELTGDQRDLAEAQDVLERARDAAGGPSAPEWATINEMLAHIRARRGERDPHRTALDALRSAVWNVLLQEDPAQARRAAQDAGPTAIEAARMCLLAGKPDEAVEALEGGRGLMLFAAGEFRDAATRLESAGQRELAERWRRVVEKGEADAAPTSLRTDVLTVLSEQTGVLDPPKMAEIRHALRVLDADALIYLLPSGDGHPGYAVAAPVEGPPGYVGLANLTDDQDRDVETWLRVLASRDIDSAEDAEVSVSSAEALDKLCDWAWRAAVRPVVETYLPELPAPANGRVPRVILVPMGRLALVPWQAARRGDGVFALELCAFSLAISARMLCRAAAAASVPTAPVGLVLGDPDTGRKQDELPAARVEAYAVHQAFYRGGTYLGTRADGTASRAGAGTAAEILGWLRDVRPGAGPVLHLACHAGVEGKDADLSAFLLLANGERVTAEQIVHALSSGPDRGIGLAVLAACRTNRSVHGYDEAYSVGTAFLAGGVRSVLSTQWAVPDRSTSVLMYMFHHFLTGRGLPAWAALREAQLWMLDPERPVPPGMPKPLLRQLDRIGEVGLDAWAGFVHQGQ